MKVPCALLLLAALTVPIYRCEMQSDKSQEARSHSFQFSMRPSQYIYVYYWNFFSMQGWTSLLYLLAFVWPVPFAVASMVSRRRRTEVVLMLPQIALPALSATVLNELFQLAAKQDSHVQVWYGGYLAAFALASYSFICLLEAIVLTRNLIRKR